MANPVLGKSLCSDWFFLGQDFAVRTISMETVQSVYFCFTVTTSGQYSPLRPSRSVSKRLVFELQIAMKVSEVSNFSAMLDQSRGQVRIIHLLIYPQFKYCT